MLELGSVSKKLKHVDISLLFTSRFFVYFFFSLQAAFFSIIPFRMYFFFFGNYSCTLYPPWETDRFKRLSWLWPWQLTPDYFQTDKLSPFNGFLGCFILTILWKVSNMFVFFHITFNLGISILFHFFYDWKSNILNFIIQFECQIYFLFLQSYMS